MPLVSRALRLPQLGHPSHSMGEGSRLVKQTTRGGGLRPSGRHLDRRQGESVYRPSPEPSYPCGHDAEVRKAPLLWELRAWSWASRAEINSSQPCSAPAARPCPHMMLCLDWKLSSLGRSPSYSQ